jgi:pimeloyl-ACP methyl ester carboxylesterase
MLLNGMRRLGALGVALIPLWSGFSGAQAAEPLSAVDSRAYAQPTQLVAVEGGRRLNLFCLGSGAPVVVLESGAGDGTTAWRKVQSEIAKTTRVCAYDRAGYGFSDPADRPSDARNAAADLHELLLKSGLGRPVILVGHSLGGLYVELFAATYPRQVAGAVLVDPTGLEDFRLANGVITDSERAQFREAFLKRAAGYDHCVSQARRGETPGPVGSDCAPRPLGDQVLDEVARQQREQPKYYEALRSEMTNFYPADYPDGADGVITNQVRRRPMRLGDKPLIVLKTPGRVPPGERGERLRAASLAVGRTLATASRRGKLVEIASGHYIQLEHPEAVIGAVQEVVEAVRARR